MIKALTGNVTYHSRGQISCLRYKDDHAIFSLKFRKVYPIPNCTASTENIDLTKHLKTVSVPNGLFYEVTVSLRYHHVQKNHIHRQLGIVCCVGTKMIEHSLQFNNDDCTDEISKTYVKGSSLSGIEVLSIVVLCFVFLIPFACLCIDILDNARANSCV
ncbi:unnamed protein product [Mytilus edulis]|uniref:Uncharacterized protein n=1 Tax=Mytilus edulis TaxID=6550 RepID=A0A8S3QQ19_MYTED|nr:unnamed protein product [Mytilus edulis]